MSSIRDTLSANLRAAEKRRAALLKKVAEEDAAIAKLQAKQRAQFTRELRRNAHRPVRLSRIEREIAAVLGSEASL